MKRDQQDFDRTGATPGTEAFSPAERKILLLTDSALMLVRLFQLETKRALQQVPDLMTVLLLRIPMLILLWLSLSVFASYLCYLVSAGVWIALLCFVLLQLAASLVLQLRYLRIWHELSLPETRKQVQAYCAAVIGAGVQEDES